MKENIVSASFGIQVKLALVQRRMSQKDLAQELGVSRQYLCDVLAGRRPGWKYQADICRLLELDQPA
ncbi:MAG: helix-turn-helix transcriptional regulator [Peptococcaceae bacterium]|nr:helix-turn-helix transcriptional regulator [Peptococcaceae bacterium]